MKLFYFFLLVTLVAVQSALANPVTFKGGYGVMPAYNKDWFDVQLNYSILSGDAPLDAPYERGDRQSLDDD